MQDNFWQRVVATIQGVSALDWIGIGLLMVFIVLGLFRGARWQFRRFLGVLVSIVAARLLAPQVAPVVTNLIDAHQPKIGLGASFLFLFLFSLVFLALLFHFLKPNPAKASKEDGEEEESKHRLLGSCFGILTAVELFLVILVCSFLFCSEERNARLIASSKGAAVSSKLILFLGEGFPLEVRESVQTARKTNSK